MLKYSTVPVMILPMAKASMDHISNSMGIDIGPIVMEKTDSGLKDNPLNGSVFTMSDAFNLNEDDVVFFTIEGYYVNSHRGYKGFCITRIEELSLDSFLEKKLANK